MNLTANYLLETHTCVCTAVLVWILIDLMHFLALYPNPNHQNLMPEPKPNPNPQP